MARLLRDGSAVILQGHGADPYLQPTASANDDKGMGCEDMSGVAAFPVEVGGGLNQ